MFILRLDCDRTLLWSSKTLRVLCKIERSEHAAINSHIKLHLPEATTASLRMASFGGVNGAPMLWQEARNPEGRVYYYHTVTKATQWYGYAALSDSLCTDCCRTKPVELMTPAEVRGFVCV